jgi:hypothetical protein
MLKSGVDPHDGPTRRADNQPTALTLTNLGITLPILYRAKTLRRRSTGMTDTAITPLGGIR